MHKIYLTTQKKKRKVSIDENDCIFPSQKKKIVKFCLLFIKNGKKKKKKKNQ